MVATDDSPSARFLWQIFFAMPAVLFTTATSCHVRDAVVVLHVVSKVHNRLIAARPVIIQ